MVFKLELKDFVMQPCKSRLAFEFLPKKNGSLEIEKIAACLKKNGAEIEVETAFLLVCRLQNHGVSVFKSGKIIVKDCENEIDARKTAELLMQKMQ